MICITECNAGFWIWFVGPLRNGNDAFLFLLIFGFNGEASRDGPGCSKRAFATLQFIIVLIQTLTKGANASPKKAVN